MATANNTIKTRVQLKSDTEANWNRLGPKDGSPGFIPLRGELIIYSADSGHAYSRLKVGDGSTNIINLPFIDSGTINGEEVEIVKVMYDTDLPSNGSSDKLYITISDNKIYHYETATGYTQLLNFTPSVQTTVIKNVTFWQPGGMTEGKIENNTLVITNGVAPQLFTGNVTVVTDVS